MEQINQINYIKGALLGGWCGDAAGATLEFYNSELTDEKVVRAMHMPAGGCFNVGSGQVTDDSELEISLLNALVEHNEMSKNNNKNPHRLFPTSIIAKHYMEWYKSEPFDIGTTTAKSFYCANNVFDILANADNLNKLSEANGSLMRCVPLSIWCKDMEPNQIMFCAKKDSSLTHSSDICKYVCGIYLIGLVSLLQNYEKNISVKTLLALNDIKNTILSLLTTTSAVKTIFDWYNQAIGLKTLDDYNCKQHIGHVKHAFILFIYCLHKNLTYESAIYEVLKKGGDTDTNAKIVGSAIGALNGELSIPQYMKNPVLEFDCEMNSEQNTNLNGQKRPKTYSVKKAYENINRLIV